MKKTIIFVELMLISWSLFSQEVNDPGSKSSLKLSAQAEHKVLSGRLYEQLMVAEKLTSDELKSTKINTCSIILYFENYPSAEQIIELKNLGAVLYFETWTPALENHKYGFLVAEVPVNSLQNILELSFIKKVDSAERQVRQ